MAEENNSNLWGAEPDRIPRSVAFSPSSPLTLDCSRMVPVVRLLVDSLYVGLIYRLHEPPTLLCISVSLEIHQRSWFYPRLNTSYSPEFIPEFISNSVIIISSIWALNETDKGEIYIKVVLWF